MTKRCMYFQHDEASVHVYNPVTHNLNRIFPNWWTDKYELHVSPDPNSLD